MAVVEEDDRIVDLLMTAEPRRPWSTTSTAARSNLEPAIGAAFIDFGQGRDWLPARAT